MALFPTLRTRVSRSEHRTDQAEVDRLVWAWRAACEGTGLHRVTQTVTGPTVTTPALVHVVLGPPTILTVALLAGQVAADVRAVAVRVAAALGVAGVHVHPRGPGHVLVELLDRDPLADVVPLDLTARSPGAVLLGRTETGEPITLDSWVDAGHAVVQGVTGAGKSGFAYAVLAQLVRDSAVRVAGVDPTGLLLRPFAGTADARWQVTSLRDPGAVEVLLTRLVDELDARVAALPVHLDRVELGPDRPCVLVVLEEFPGLLRALDAADVKLGKRVRALVARLLAEGRKAGVRVLLLAQRAEAATIGAFERAMCDLRVSFRTDNRSAVELLHPGTDSDTADAHTTALPGVALISRPGHPLSRFRAPWLGSYAAYSAAVRAGRGDGLRND